MTATSDLIKRSIPFTDSRLEGIISEWCHVIAHEVAERRFFDKAEVEAYAKGKLAVALHDCIRIQNDDLLNERSELVEKYNRINLSQPQKNILAAKIAAINVKIKERNKAISGIENRFMRNEFQDAPQKKKFTSQEDRVVVGRLSDIHKMEVYSVTTFTRSFILCVGLNRKNPGFNESNYIKLTLRQDKCKIIEDFKEGDIIACTYSFHGTNFEGQRGTVYMNNLICGQIELAE